MFLAVEQLFYSQINVKRTLGKFFLPYIMMLIIVSISENTDKISPSLVYLNRWLVISVFTAGVL